ncbi:MAG: hypothetical protein HUU60_11495 [Armatimonadetes bacterium]|nr:hypothetical protein [Armatimonadota bacterium]
MEFYNVKARQKVNVDDKEVKTQKYERKTKSGAKQVRYALTATHDGQKLFKFVNEEMYKKFGGK